MVPEEIACLADALEDFFPLTRSEALTAAHRIDDALERAGVTLTMKERN